MTVQLFKKTGTYFSEKDKKDKPYTNFYIQCNDQLIPIEVKYFPNAKFDNRDPGYQGRFQVLSAFAELLPDIEEKPKNAEAKKRNPHKINCPECGKIMRIDDQDDESYYLACDDCNVAGFFNVKTGALSFEKDGADLPF